MNGPGVLAADQPEVAPDVLEPFGRRRRQRGRECGRHRTSCRFIRKTRAAFGFIEHHRVIQREPVHRPAVDHRPAVGMRERRDRAAPLLDRPVQRDVVGGARHRRRRLLGLGEDIEREHGLARDRLHRLAGGGVGAVDGEAKVVRVVAESAREPLARVGRQRGDPGVELRQDHRVAGRAPERGQEADRRGPFEFRGVLGGWGERAADDPGAPLVERGVGRIARVERARRLHQPVRDRPSRTGCGRRRCAGCSAAPGPAARARSPHHRTCRRGNPGRNGSRPRPIRTR